jgi:hypothetical protein
MEYKVIFVQYFFKKYLLHNIIKIITKIILEFTFKANDFQKKGLSIYFIRKFIDL